jgi:hypothetical protein
MPETIQKAGFTRKTAQTGAVTLIQRFGRAKNKDSGAADKAENLGG